MGGPIGVPNRCRLKDRWHVEGVRMHVHRGISTIRQTTPLVSTCLSVMCTGKRVAGLGNFQVHPAAWLGAKYSWVQGAVRKARVVRGCCPCAAMAFRGGAAV